MLLDECDEGRGGVVMLDGVFDGGDGGERAKDQEKRGRAPVWIVIALRREIMRDMIDISFGVMCTDVLCELTNQGA